MRKACVNKVMLGERMNLRLVLEATEWMRENYPVVVLFEGAAGGFGVD